MQQNVNGSAFFRKAWLTFKNGFGDPASNYWIGKENLYQLTNILCNCTLHIDMYHKGAWYYADYSSFSICNEADRYRLILGTMTSDNVTTALEGQKNKQFSTCDMDNDQNTATHCEASLGVGWWYGTSTYRDLNISCGTTNLNAELQYFYWSGFNPTSKYNLLSSKMYAICDSKSPQVNQKS